MEPVASRIAIDFFNTTDHAVGPENGLSAADFESVRERTEREIARVWSEHEGGDQRWIDLPDNRALADEIEAFAAANRDQYENFLLIGIGGSSLGAIATIQALAHPQRNLQSDADRIGPRFFVLDNPDPERVQGILDVIDLSKTLINVVTKSGQTAETMANFLVVKTALEKAVGVEQSRKQIVATTDAKSGLLRPLAEQEGYKTFPVPDGVDGRMTVLSAVGLLPAAMCGVDIHSMLAGAAAMRSRCGSSAMETNPAGLLAAIAYLSDTSKGKSMLVTMPYADALYGISDWFRQLWAESLGKKESLSGEIVFAGQTPIKSLGAIDQHSQIQLYTEGPNDKLISLIAVDHYRATVKVSSTPEGVTDLDYLRGAELGTLLDRERLATAYALTKASRPNFTMTVPTIDAGVIGEFFFLYEMQTVLAGGLYQVNPFGQPGVEAGKNATYALMNREEYSSLKADLLDQPAIRNHYVLNPV